MMNWSDEIRSDVLQLRADRLSGGTLTLYTAPKPAIGASITTQEALVTATIPISLTVVDNLLTLLIPSATILRDGEAAWGRIIGPTDEFLLDGDCGLMMSTALFKLQTTAMTTGGVMTTLIATFAEA